MIYNPIAVMLCATIGVTAILLAHGIITPLTWRITDTANGRLWLSFGVVLVATLPARMDTLPVWLCVIVVLAFTAAFYVALDRWILLPTPHTVRRVAMVAERRTTWIDNKPPVGYRWLNQRTVAAFG